MARGENCKSCKFFADNEEFGECTSSEENQEQFLLLGYGAATICEGYVEKPREASLLVNNTALRYIMAGDSHFKMVSGNTGVVIYFKIKKIKSTTSKGDPYVFSVKTKVLGSYIYAGILSRDPHWDIWKFYRGNQGELEESHVNIKSLIYVVNKFYKGEINLNVKVIHDGKCGKCGRPLNNKSSEKTGLGSECIKSVENPRRSKDAPNNKYLDK